MAENHGIRMSDLTGTVRVQCRHGACFTLMRWKRV